MRHLFMSLMLLSSLWLGGCGYKEGATASDQQAYLHFSGNTKDVTVSVDGANEFSVESSRNNPYKIRPGKHTVKVYRNGQVVVHREVYVGDGISKEIGIE